MAAAENTVVEDAVESSGEPGSKLLRGQFSRPTLLFKGRAPKFSPGKIKKLSFLSPWISHDKKDRIISNN